MPPFCVCMWICICQKSQHISTCICSQDNPLILTESIANIDTETRYSIYQLCFIPHASSSHRSIQTFYLLSFLSETPKTKKREKIQLTDLGRKRQKKNKVDKNEAKRRSNEQTNKENRQNLYC